MNASTAEETNALFRIDKATRVFKMGEVEVPALVDADLVIRPGEFIVIQGPSGSGKSTLLNVIGGMDRPTSRHIHHRASDLSKADDEALTDYRRSCVGFIFQFYNLVPTLTALENVQVATELMQDLMEPAEALDMV